MELLELILQLVNEHPVLSQILIDGSLIFALIFALYRLEKSHAILTHLMSFIGDKLTANVKTWVAEYNSAMEERIKEDFRVRIKEVEDRMETYKQEGDQKDLFGKADYYHDQIMLFADKIKAGKTPGYERGKNMVGKVVYYENLCEEHPEYDNGVCPEACAYIKDWWTRTYGYKKGEYNETVK